LVNLVTQLALNYKFVPVAKVCGLCSSANHHTDLCPSMQQPGEIEQPEAYAANILPSKMLLAQADHTFLHQSNNSNNPRNSQQLRLLLNLSLKNL